MHYRFLTNEELFMLYNFTKHNNLDMSQFSEEQLAHFKSVFRIFDLNDDGSISNEELAVVFLAGISQRLGYRLSSELLAKVVERMNMGKNGEITFDEFLQAIPGNATEFDASVHRKASVRNKFSEAEENKTYLRGIFNQYDADGNGFIDHNEATTILKSFGFEEKEIDKLIKDHDTNNDGKLDYEEFISFWGHTH
ncbi:unnamed protein product [Owenia fusiformis]|uniref:EF-hand domain-containing protein n=1 Tax=Owenia fusiformis TaxID=6347 RepID=A0A8S4NBS0_OWEFU|nr:unnamed protein product [Owenia fusiformis]